MKTSTADARLADKIRRAAEDGATFPYRPMDRAQVVADACRMLRMGGPGDAVQWIVFCLAAGVSE